MTEQIAIWWIRKDIRLEENPIVNWARDNKFVIIPLFILDSILLEGNYTNIKRNQFLFGGLASLHTNLQEKGGKLTILKGGIIESLKKVMASTGSNLILAEADYSSYSISRDKKIIQELPLKFIDSPAVLLPGSIVKKDGNPYQVFTAFRNEWIKKVQIPISSPNSQLGSILVPGSDIASENDQIYRSESTSTLFPPGEKKALIKLSEFTEGVSAPIYTYAINRDRLDKDGTSRLSPYIKFGMISPKKIVFQAFQAIRNAPNLEAQKSAEIWLNELIWRDFYIHILFHYPSVINTNFRKMNIAWDNDPKNIQAWKEGKTGYPIVDAGMHQLINTGWMHNRARMITASFLTKDLLVHWKIGEEFFMQNLIDGDPSSNNGGWQWTAGTGTDAAPYFRIFNPITQSKVCDPDGKFIRTWLPELSFLPDKYIHEPWKTPLEIQQKSNCLIGTDYPFPIIDHKFARERVLKAYGSKY